MADLPAIDDLLDPDYLDQAWNQLNKVNRNAAGTLVGSLPEATAASRPTAEYGNGVTAALRQLSEFVQGTEEVTALHVATTLRLPRFTTALRPAAGTSGRLIYDTDLDTILVDDGAAWDDIGTGTGGALTVLGVAGNASATRADIAASTNNTFLGRTSDALSFSAVAVNQLSDQTLYSIDFSTLANNTLSNGTETIDGFGWTIANAAAATTFAVENGTGIHFDAAASSTAYTTSSRTATNMSILLSTLIPTWDPQRDYVIEVYFSSLTLGTSNNRVLLCLENTENTSQERLMGGGRQNVSGTQRFSNQNEATIRTSTPTTATNCFALRVSAGQMVVCAGTSSGGDFPSSYTHADAISCTNGASVSSPTALLTIAFVTGEAGGAMDAVLRRLRVRRV